GTANLSAFRRFRMAEWQFLGRRRIDRRLRCDWAICIGRAIRLSMPSPTCGAEHTSSPGRSAPSPGRCSSPARDSAPWCSQLPLDDPEQMLDTRPNGGIPPIAFLLAAGERRPAAALGLGLVLDTPDHPEGAGSALVFV